VITAFVIVVAVAAFFVYRALSADTSAEVTYTTGTVEKMTLTSSISGVGNMELSTSATVTPSVSGEVSGLSVAEGDTVVEGQVLFTIVNPELDIAVESAQNAYDKAVLAVASAELSVLQAEQSLSDLYEQYEEQSTSTTTSQTTGTLPSTITTAPPTTTTQPSTTTTQPSTTTTDPYTTTSEQASSTTQPFPHRPTMRCCWLPPQPPRVVVRRSSEITYLDIQAAKQR
jgi:acetyl/propionyl-CoA carboxylase alpha subunit